MNEILDLQHMMDNALIDVKKRKGIAIDDILWDDLLKSIISATAMQMQVELNITTGIPKMLGFILTEVTLIRFNSINAEGFQSKGQDGYSFSKFDIDDFAAFRSTMKVWLDLNDMVDPMNAKVTFIGGDC